MKPYSYCGSLGQRGHCIHSTGSLYTPPPAKFAAALSRRTPGLYGWCVAVPGYPAPAGFGGVKTGKGGRLAWGLTHKARQRPFPLAEQAAGARAGQLRLPRPGLSPKGPALNSWGRFWGFLPQKAPLSRGCPAQNRMWQASWARMVKIGMVIMESTVETATVLEARAES